MFRTRGAKGKKVLEKILATQYQVWTIQPSQSRWRGGIKFISWGNWRPCTRF